MRRACCSPWRRAARLSDSRSRGRRASRSVRLARRQIDSDPDSLFIAFTAPRVSLVPGRIRFATLVVRTQDSNVQWEARLENVSVDVALADLARRRFHARTVRAGRLAFRLREKLTPAEATPPRMRRYPRIAGFTDPPRRDPSKAPAAPGNPWRVVVDDLRVGKLQEIWIDAWRWEGEGLVSGGFRLRPGIEAEVLPSELKIGSGILRWGADVVSRGTAGRVAASLPRFDTQKYPGNEIWKIMSGAASLDGTLESVPFLWPEGGKPAVTGGGTVRVRLAMRDGRGGGNVSARLEDARPLVGLVPHGPPKWVAGLVDLHDFGVVARVRIAPGTLAASPVRAEAGTLSLRADWRQAARALLGRASREERGPRPRARPRERRRHFASSARRLVRSRRPARGTQDRSAARLGGNRAADEIGGRRGDGEDAEDHGDGPAARGACRARSSCGRASS